MVQWVGVPSHTPKVYGFDPLSRHVQEAADQRFSLTSMFLSLSLISKNISLGED